MYLEFNTESPAISYWIRLFDLDQEYNIPTVYNGLLLALAGAFSVIVFMRTRSLWWIALSVIFIYLGLDETLLIHEQIAEPLRLKLALDNTSLLYHAWVIPASLVSVAMGTYLLVVATRKKIVNFTPNILILYIFALALGAVILEMLSTKTYGNIVFYRSFSVLVEELYEMSFSSLILYRVLRSLNH